MVQPTEQSFETGAAKKPLDRLEIVIAGGVEIGVPHPHRIARTARCAAVEATGRQNTRRHTVADQESGAFESMGQGGVFAECAARQSADRLVSLEGQGKIRTRMDPMVWPGIMRPRIQDSRNLRYEAQKAILEPTATQKSCAERNVFDRIGIDVSCDRVDSGGQCREVCSTSKGVGRGYRHRSSR